RSKKNAFGIETQGNNLIKAEPADLSNFSQSDLIALNYGINEVKDLDFGKIKAKSHDDAYDKTDLNKEIKLTDIANMFDNSKDIVEYIKR
ncbi:MAG TPA: hypothetical protein PLG58_08720, partial [Flexilinea sp.]|nr:hypothetical protein [Flexilinea sp.]